MAVTLELKERIDSMDFTIRKAKESDAHEIARIFNYYIQNGFAAFLDEPVEAGALYQWLDKVSYNDSVYAVENSGKMAGFGLIKQYYDMKVFKNTAEPGYFLSPEYTGKRAGTKLFEVMEKDARKMGVKNFVVSISSLNPRSIDFHIKNGFKKCADFSAVGRKLDRDFDVVWMQKIL
jgi:L-amino acid N-acyltransferase YncA